MVNRGNIMREYIHKYSRTYATAFIAHVID